MRVAILGATSHIARNLLTFFAREPGTELWLFARRPAAVNEFLRAEGLPEAAWCGSDFSELRRSDCMLVINCVGAGTPTRLRGDTLSNWFTLTEFSTIWPSPICVKSSPMRSMSVSAAAPSMGVGVKRHVNMTASWRFQSTPCRPLIITPSPVSTQSVNIEQ